jgi:hypothetical protein
MGWANLARIATSSSRSTGCERHSECDNFSMASINIDSHKV